MEQEDAEEAEMWVRAVSERMCRTLCNCLLFRPGWGNLGYPVQGSERFRLSGVGYRGQVTAQKSDPRLLSSNFDALHLNSCGSGL